MKPRYRDPVFWATWAGALIATGAFWTVIGYVAHRALR